MSRMSRQPHAKSWLIGKDSDAGRDWGQEEKGTPEDEIAGWHHWLDGRESQWTPGVGDGQGGLACCDSWGHKESDTTERLIWSDLRESVPTGTSFLVGVIKMFLIDVVMGAQLCGYIKKQWIVHFKWMNCVACELYHTKTVTKKIMWWKPWKIKRVWESVNS